MYFRFSPLFLVWMLAGYLIGAMCSNHIFMDMARTHWANLWVYFWLFLWPMGLAYFVMYYILLIIFVVVIGLLITGLVLNVGPLAKDEWRMSSRN